MIKFEKESVVGFEEAIRGMRNPMNSWDLSDSDFPCDGNFGYSGAMPCESVILACIPIFASSRITTSVLRKL